LASASNQKSTRKSSYHHGDLRRALIDAALQTITEQGVSALTLREVAQQVGVSRMAPYRHFADKAALLAAVAEEGFRALKAQLIQAAGQLEPTERLQAIGVAYVEYAVTHAAHYRVMFGTERANRPSFPALLQVASETFDVLVQTLVACQQSGTIRVAEPVEQAQIAWSLVHGLSMLAIDGHFTKMERGSISDLAATATRTLVEGLQKQD
jgi:AcrR family transcriptional regulator